MTRDLPRPLAVSLGDPAGIGPELVAEAWSRRRAESLPPFFVVGGESALKTAASSRGLEINVTSVASPQEALAAFADALPVLEGLDGAFTPGEPTRAGAKLALASLEAATGLAILGQASGLITGPIAKGLLARVGFEYPGQTEFVADACGVAADDAVMMLAGPNLRAVPLTVHCALADVPGLLDKNMIVRRSRIVARALHEDFGIERPRLAVAALNPHAGEDGRFGREDLEIVAPAVERLVQIGIDATGPHPADALFTARARASYDAAICMYHDQALIPLKALDFDAGVNVTLGLPIVRTSPDHGTAFDIAGKGRADPGATIAAIRMAGAMAARRAANG